jgi:hypothetical protein
LKTDWVISLLGQKISTYKAVARKSHTPGNEWEGNIEMDLKEISSDVTKFVHVAWVGSRYLDTVVVNATFIIMGLILLLCGTENWEYESCSV